MIKQALLIIRVVPQALVFRRGKELLSEDAWRNMLPSDMAWPPVFQQLNHVLDPY